ncbi:MAG: enoyl-CoA hydratase/isomerase family protein [Caulobacteraceae bacterium]|nr:enoyl-CoA hydratase/isomerase family protein [Caulobacteraceae bacterium]
MSETRAAEPAATEEPAVLYELKDKVAIVTLNRPHRHNALDDASAILLGELMDRARDDTEARVTLLRGNGPSFCAGRDTAVLGKRVTGLSDFEHLSRSLRKKIGMLDSQKPIIAALHGHVIGGGFQNALKADIRIAADDAKMRLPEIDWGIMSDGGATSLIAALAGPSRAKLLIMTGRSFSAREALEWGLVDIVVPRDRLDEEAMALARDIAAKPPMNVMLAKQLVDALYGPAIRENLRNEMVALTAIYKSEDYQEARAARAEKREASFKGR